MSNSSATVSIAESCFRTGNFQNSVTFKFTGETAALTLNSSSNEECYFTLSYQGHFFSTIKILYSSLSKDTSCGLITLGSLISLNSFDIEFCSYGYPIKLFIKSIDSKKKINLSLDLKYMSNNHQLKMQNLTDNIVKSLVREIDSIKSKLDFRGNSDISSMQTCIIEGIQAKIDSQDKALANLQMEILDLKGTLLNSNQLELKVETLTKSFDSLSEKLHGDHCKALTNLKNNVDDLQIKLNPVMEEFEKNCKDNSSRQKQLEDLEERIKQSLVLKAKVEESKAFAKSLVSESFANFAAKIEKLESKLNDQNSYFRKSFEFISQDLKFTKTDFNYKVSSLKEQHTQANPRNDAFGLEFEPHFYNPTKKHEVSYSNKYSKSDYSIVAEYKYEGRIYSLADFGVSEYIIGCCDGSIHFRNKLTHETTRSLPKEHNKGVYALLVIGDQLVSGSNDKSNNLKIWNLSNCNQKSITLSGHTGSVYCLALVKSNIISSGSSDNSIMLWDIITNTNIIKLCGHTSIVWGLIMLNKNTLVSASFDGTVRFWDVNNASKAAELQNRRITDGNEKFISILGLSESKVALGTNNGKLNIWDVEVNKLIKSFSEHNNWVTRLVKLNSNLIGSCSCDKSIRIWDTELMTQVAVLEGHSDYVNGLLQLNDSKLLSVSYDQSLKVWGSK